MEYGLEYRRGVTGTKGWDLQKSWYPYAFGPDVLFFITFSYQHILKLCFAFYHITLFFSSGITGIVCTHSLESCILCTK